MLVSAGQVQSSLDDRWNDCDKINRQLISKFAGIDIHKYMQSIYAHYIYMYIMQFVYMHTHQGI